MKRWLQAWAWVALWLWVLGRATHAFPVGLPGAAVLGALLTPGIYLPLVLARREEAPDVSGELSAPLAVALAGLVFSLVVLGALSLLGHWDQRPRGASFAGVAAAVVGLHVAAALCTGLAERWWWGDPDDDLDD